MAAVLWPIYMLFHLLLGKLFVWLARSGENNAWSSHKAQSVRIELEKKIRIEQERVVREIEKEIDGSLKVEIDDDEDDEDEDDDYATERRFVR
jgi:hypothetical protein